MALHLPTASSTRPVLPSARVSHTAESTEGPFPKDASDTPSEFLSFANIGEAIAATPAKLEKIRLLADYLGGLTSEQLPIAALYFTGRAFAQSDLRTLQVGWAVIFRALQAATSIDDAELHRIAGAHGDAGKSRSEEHTSELQS